MDWSLVLVSQGIETTIEGSENSAGWGLRVGEADYPRAIQALRLYQLENRRWLWQQNIFEPTGYLFDWASLAWVLLVCLFFWATDGRSELRAAGEMDSLGVSQGQWWRLFTAIWLHADLAHLAGNATFGFLLLGLAMGRYGTGIGLLAAYFAGVGGNLAAFLLSAKHLSLGASGMVMGGLGLLAIQSPSLWRQSPRGARYLLSGICGGIMLFVLLGLTPGTDVLAHFSGFASGLLIGGLLSLFPGLTRRPVPNLICGFLFAALVIWPWGFALRHAG
jgi:rhomboid protease GluP